MASNHKKNYTEVTQIKNIHSSNNYSSAVAAAPHNICLQCLAKCHLAHIYIDYTNIIIGMSRIWSGNIRSLRRVMKRLTNVQILYGNHLWLNKVSAFVGTLPCLRRAKNGGQPLPRLSSAGVHI